jgi:signal transduction histidine kinase
MNVTYWNKGMESITGIVKIAAQKQTIFSLLPWISPNTFETSEQREMTIRTPSQQFFKINISPVTDPSGGFVVIFEDITEKKKMEEQLVQALKLASIGKLTAGISHEIGNPLASISSLVQELRSIPAESCNEKNFFSDSLSTINNHIERIARIVRSLGDFARLSTKEKIPSNLQEILERTISLVRYDKRFKDIDLKTEIDDVPPIRVNPDQIQQVFLNLMLNAIDVMPDGGRIDISMKQKDSIVEIGFHDTGPGIDSAIIDKIFDPFFTTKPLGKGTGLGLSICYGIIKEHNGTITAKSEKGAGTVFTISLPVN